MRRITFGLSIVITLLPAFHVGGNEPAPIQYKVPVELCKLQNKDIGESSGIAISRRDPNRIWTHNDSGGKPRLFCFDREGKHLGTCRLKKVNAIDWEDMCSFQLDGKPMLMVADTGDNGAKRRTYLLNIIEEPEKPSDDTKHVQVVRLRYSSGPMDCEAIGVDPIRREIIFVEKRISLYCRVFRAKLPGPLDKEVVAEPIGRLRIPVVTAMDISPDGRRAIVMTLGEAFEFTRDSTETWQEAFRKSPRKVKMPPRRQGEAICYAADGLELLLTSEMLPTPLFSIAAQR